MAEFRQARCQHLHRALLQGNDLVTVLIKLAIGIDLDLHPAFGPLFHQLGEVSCRASLGSVLRDDVTELDDNRLLRDRGSGEGQCRRSEQSGNQSVHDDLYTAGSAATLRHADSICVRRIGRNTNQAISAAIAFMMLAVMKTACQLPVIVVSTLDKGTRSEAVPLAV